MRQEEPSPADCADLEKSYPLHCEHEERYRDLVENLNDAIYTIDSNGIVTYVSPILSRITGYGPDRVIGRRYLEFVSDEDRPCLLKRFEDIREGTLMILEWRVRKEDSSLCWVRTSSRPLFRDGNFSGIQGTITDISEKKKAEIALHEANRKLHLLNSVTRHDIRNKLLALTIFLSELQESLTDPKMLDYAGRSIDAVKAVARQVEFTKEYQALGEQSARWQKITGSLPEILAPGILVAPGTADLEIFADPMLGTVFYNLYDNAIRHGKHATEIRIYHHETPEGLIIICEDNGAGIPEEEKTRIFERGFGSNTGFGLFLVREILGITGIAIKETGEAGRGARFEINVPNGSYRHCCEG
jgi:PAS domain S-box-containing protein